MDTHPDDYTPQERLTALEAFRNDLVFLKKKRNYDAACWILQRVVAPRCPRLAGKLQTRLDDRVGPDFLKKLELEKRLLERSRRLR